jgi:hypothetical protein
VADSNFFDLGAACTVHVPPFLTFFTKQNWPRNWAGPGTGARDQIVSALERRSSQD